MPFRLESMDEISKQADKLKRWSKRKDQLGVCWTLADILQVDVVLARRRRYLQHLSRNEHLASFVRANADLVDVDLDQIDPDAPLT